MNRGHSRRDRWWASGPGPAWDRRRRVAAAGRLMIAGLLLVAGCGRGRGRSAAVPPSTKLDTASIPVTTSAPYPCPANPPGPNAPGGSPDLGRLFVTSVPPDYQQVDDATADSGPTDADALAKEDGEPGALAALQQAGYVRGYEREWAKSTPEDRVTVGLYLFATGAGAAGYLQRLQAEDAEPAGDGTVPTRFPVPAVPGASGWVTAGPTGSSATVDYAKCAYVAVVEVDGSATEGNPALAARLAADQFAKL